MLEIRPYQESDEAAVRRICLLTGDDGGDGTALFPDADLLSDIFAIPYTVFDPDLCFVAVDGDGGRVVGYIVGTADSSRFARQFRQHWLPRVSGRHQAPPEHPDRAAEDPQSVMAWRLHHPRADDPRLLADYPAHLHVDLLPEAQGQGCGRALMMCFLRAAREHGAQGVHLGVSATNTNARGFYARLGFEPFVLPADEDRAGNLLVRSTTLNA